MIMGAEHDLVFLIVDNLTQEILGLISVFNEFSHWRGGSIFVIQELYLKS